MDIDAMGPAAADTPLFVRGLFSFCFTTALVVVHVDGHRIRPHLCDINAL